jgi:hypothetical protein
MDESSEYLANSLLSVQALRERLFPSQDLFSGEREEDGIRTKKIRSAEKNRRMRKRLKAGWGKYSLFLRSFAKNIQTGESYY